MRRLALVGAALAAAFGVYMLVFKPSPADRLRGTLVALSGPDGTVALENCDLSIVVDSAGVEGCT